MLWIYAKEVWGSTFDIPSDPRAREVKTQVWLDVLGDLDAGIVRRTMASSGAHFAPTPPELRRLVHERMAVESGQAPTPDYDQALRKLNELVSRCGAHWHNTQGRRSPLELAEEFHPALADAIRAMRWENICASTSPETFRAQFREVWQSAAGRHERTRFPGPPLLSQGSAPQLATAGERR